jgi:hypothetical protein
MLIKEIKNDMMAEVLAAKNIKDRYYEEAAKKSEKLFNELFDRLLKKVSVLTDDELIGLANEILNGNINDDTHIIMGILGMRLSDSNNPLSGMIGTMMMEAAAGACLKSIKKHMENEDDEDGD